MPRSLEERDRDSQRFTRTAGFMALCAITLLVGSTLYMAVDVSSGLGAWQVWVGGYFFTGLFAYLTYYFAQRGAYVPD